MRLPVYPYDTTRQAPCDEDNAVLWYLSGVSMNRMAFLLRVSAQAVRTWIRDLAQTTDPNLQSAHRQARSSVENASVAC